MWAGSGWAQPHNNWTGSAVRGGVNDPDHPAILPARSLFPPYHLSESSSSSGQQLTTRAAVLIRFRSSSPQTNPILPLLPQLRSITVALQLRAKLLLTDMIRETSIGSKFIDQRGDSVSKQHPNSFNTFLWLLIYDATAASFMKHEGKPSEEMEVFFGEFKKNSNKEESSNGQVQLGRNLNEHALLTLMNCKTSRWITVEECQCNDIVDSLTSLEAMSEFHGTNGLATAKKHGKDFCQFLHFLRLSSDGL
ncbi:hypothetical protein HHK36_022310 [Tetracentron sinense]|uniref:Uncharacterized protein n=1 Tax=Tetracentron sinense TaxID=13715 RepID=A0A834YPL4_TETSI|nr:hypothetical protein HHK36_022310 [Tetracentron sinense]